MMPAPGPRQAIEAINACAEPSDAEKAAAIAKCIDANVVAGIANTPTALRVATIRQLIAHPPPTAAPSITGGWLRDLTAEGVESNPGPEHGPASSPCPCKASQQQLLARGLDLFANCPGCPHPVNEHGEATTATTTPAPVVTIPSPNEAAWFAACHAVQPMNFPVGGGGVAAGPAVDLDFNPTGVVANPIVFPFRKVQSRMFLRFCWPFFVRVLRSGYAQLDPVDPNASPIRPTQHWVVTGTPGIGKSCFGVYLVYEFARWFHAQVESSSGGGHLHTLNIIYDNVLEDKKKTTQHFHFKAELPAGIAFGPGAGNAIVWTVVQVRDIHASQYRDLLNLDLNTIYIVDGGEDSGELHMCYSIWLTSAKKEHISAACRRPRGCVKALYQPPWSLEELQITNSMLHSAFFASSFVSYLFDRWGGSVRYVLGEPRSLLAKLSAANPLRAPANHPLALPLPAPWPEVVSGLSTAVSLSNLPAIKQFAGATSSKVPDDVSSKLMHIIPTNQDVTDDDHAFRETIVQFASSYAAIEVAKQLAGNAQYELFLFLVTAQGNPTLGEVARNLFEGHCHNMMRQLPPVRFKRRPLAGGPSVYVTFPAPPAVAIVGNERPELLFVADAEIANIPPMHHGRPASREFPAADIIRPQGGSAPCELDQATVSLHHPEKIVGLTRIHAQLNAPAYNLNFLVPHTNFPHFGLQPYHDAHGHVAPLPPGLNVTQYAIEIDLSVAGLVAAGGVAAALPLPAPAAPLPAPAPVPPAPPAAGGHVPRGKGKRQRR